MDGWLLLAGWRRKNTIRVTVDMPMRPLLFIEGLANLNRDVSQHFGGLVVQIRLALEAVARLTPDITDRAQRESALALRTARQQADQFAKRLSHSVGPQAHPSRCDGIQVAR
jgi:hypothetical protein